MSNNVGIPIDLHNPWPEIPIKSWDDFDRRLEKELGNGEHLFRGQSNKKWDLTTSLDRSFDENAKIIFPEGTHKKRRFAEKAHEDLIIKSFQKDAHLFLKFLPKEEKETLEWLALMQHYGTPTRLLDVTLSPYVATFFALEAGTDDSCVFAINHVELKKWNKEFFGEDTHEKMRKLIFTNGKSIEGKDKHLFITAFKPRYGNERQVAQQGLFLVQDEIEQTFDSVLKGYQGVADTDICRKYIISKELRCEGLKRLKRMNITSATLFPGIDGFAKSLRFQSLETPQDQRRLE